MWPHGCFEATLVESYVEPSSRPTDMHEPANDRGWDCHAKTAVAFGARDNVEAKHAFVRDDRLDESLRHDQRLQLFVSEE